jgi:hypothetical protein
MEFFVWMKNQKSSKKVKVPSRKTIFNSEATQQLAQSYRGKKLFRKLKLNFFNGSSP